MTDSEQRPGDLRIFQRDGFYSMSAGNLNASTSSQQIRLDIPRPEALRSRNEYVQITKLPARARRHKKQYRNSVPASSRLAASTETVRVRRDGSSPGREGNNHHIVRHDPPAILQPVSTISAVEKSRSNKSTSVVVSTACSTSGRRPLATPGHAVRVVTSLPRSGLDASPVSVINKQPRSSKLDSVADCSVEKRNILATLSSSSLLDSSGSIICKQCGRCRCSECALPRQLPSRLVCGDHCELSSGSVVDAISCMCCVKACLYHTTGHVYDDCGGNDYYENGVVCDCDSSCASMAMAQSMCGSHSLWSCSSKSPDRCYRWTILGSAMACFPCMWMYLPLRACAAGVETAYGKYHDNGCHCDRESASIDRLSDGRARNQRSHTLPPELPSIAAAKKQATASSIGDFRPAGDKTGRRYSFLGDEKR